MKKLKAFLLLGALFGLTLLVMFYNKTNNETENIASTTSADSAKINNAVSMADDAIRLELQKCKKGDFIKMFDTWYVANGIPDTNGTLLVHKATYSMSMATEMIDIKTAFLIDEVVRYDDSQGTEGIRVAWDSVAREVFLER